MKSDGQEAPESSSSSPTTTTTTSIVDLLGPKLLVDPSTAKSTVDVIPKEKSIVLLYFSAHWCPPCKAFTPVLRNFYRAAKKVGQPLEIVYVSSDHTLAQFNEYYGNSMPWTAIGATDDESIKAKNRLAQLFQIRGIPTLVVLRRDDASGNNKDNWLYVTNKGREQVSALSPSSSPEKLVKEWMESPAVPLDEASSVGGGDGGFSLSEIVTTLLRNPVYLFAIIYLVKYVYRAYLSSSHGAAAPVIGEDPMPPFGSGGIGQDEPDSEF